MSLFPSSIRPGRLMLYLLLGLTAATTSLSCRRQYTPKPDAYFRIDPYPETYWRTTLPGTRLSFEIPEGTTEALDPDSTHRHDGVQWLNIRFPRYRATLYCSYHPLRGNLDRLTNESRELVYRQSIRPDVVQAGHYENDSSKIYATLYDLSAESATPLQFIVTDSTRYLLRGALYFDEPGKSDSIAPVVDDLSDHIAHLIESIEIPAR